nr:MAG TPA: hypothetical protein [Caudoviricetes sp.]
MSLIIEDKDRLNSLADTIINANRSNAAQPTTVAELTEQVINFIPQSSRFSSGVVIPATEITRDNMPEIPFNLGNDNGENLIIPNMILIYQPQPITDGATLENSNVFTAIFPRLKRNDQQADTMFTMYKRTTTNYIAGSLAYPNNETTILTSNSFFLAPHSSAHWKAGQPIVWLQIKF